MTIVRTVYVNIPIRIGFIVCSDVLNVGLGWRAMPPNMYPAQARLGVSRPGIASRHLCGLNFNLQRCRVSSSAHHVGSKPGKSQTQPDFTMDQPPRERFLANPRKSSSTNSGKSVASITSRSRRKSDTTTGNAVSKNSIVPLDRPIYRDPASVFSIATQPNGKILIGGAFTSVAGLPRHGIARLHPDGALDTDFDACGWQKVRRRGKAAVRGREVKRKFAKMVR